MCMARIYRSYPYICMRIDMLDVLLTRIHHHHKHYLDKFSCLFLETDYDLILVKLIVNSTKFIIRVSQMTPVNPF